jgi:hypothetical protein
MQFTATFEIEPTGIFGLPEGTRTILPAPLSYNSDQYVEAPISPRFRKVAWGSVSVYRSPDAKINEPLDLGEVKGRIVDNYAFLTAEADGAEQAKVTFVTSIERLLQHLALKYNIPLTYNGVIMQDEAGNYYPIRSVTMHMAGFRAYELDELRREIQQIQAYVPLDDERLDRALTYFEHAVWLFEQRSQQGDVRSRQAAQVASSIFLNLWKAITAIVGDPRERDYQSRYKKLGLDYQFFKDRIDRVTQMRNDLDVAHHHLDQAILAQVEGSIGEALDTARTVIARHRELLKGQP